jgi:hypothetical protein
MHEPHMGITKVGLLLTEPLQVIESHSNKHLLLLFLLNGRRCYPEVVKEL